MPHPDPNQPWPPKQRAPIQADIETAAAWWSGDEGALIAAAQKPAPPAKRRDKGIMGRVRFWARQQQDSERQRLHAPIAADIASTSADLLFGEAPSFIIPEAHTETADPGAIAAQDRILELSERDGWVSRLLESAEVASALGGVYLRIVWDPTVTNHPLLTTVHADRAVPEFRWGRLTAVTFWSVVRAEGQRVWRHLERHERGQIRHTLHEGTRDRLGPARPLEAHPATAQLDTNDDGTITLPGALADRFLVQYIPNMRPNRRYRHAADGRPDTQGAEAFMDALDETWSSWVRDIRLAKARLIVPDEFLDRSEPGAGASFDQDREIFSPLSMDPTRVENAGITPVQFEVRAAEHAATASALLEQIISTASYSPETFGVQQTGGGEQTATGVRAREAKSLRTTMRKQSYWSPLADMLELVLIADREIFGSTIEPFRPRVQFADGLPDDPMQTAQTIALLATAEAVSTETRVRMAQPDLDEDEVKAEVRRIRETEGAVFEDPTGGYPAPTAGPDSGEMKTKADALGILIRAGVDPTDAARQVGLSDVEFTGAVPVSLRLPETDADKVEDR